MRNPLPKGERLLKPPGGGGSLIDEGTGCKDSGGPFL